MLGRGAPEGAPGQVKGGGLLRARALPRAARQEEQHNLFRASVACGAIRQVSPPETNSARWLLAPCGPC